MSENSKEANKNTKETTKTSGKSSTKSSAKSTAKNSAKSTSSPTATQSQANNVVEKEVEVKNEGQGHVFIPVSKELDSKQGEAMNINLTINLKNDEKGKRETKTKKSTAKKKTTTSKKQPASATKKSNEKDKKDKKKKKTSFLWLLLLLLLVFAVAFYFVYPYIPNASHHHKYATTWTTNDTGHWHKCTGCEEITDEGNHVYDDDCDATCNDCGYAREVTHDWNTDTYHYDSAEHWYECSVCGTEGTHTAHTHTDINDIDCICGYIRDITQAYYTTKYYVENLAGTGYDFVEETTNNIGTIGETVNATIKTYTHYIHDTTNTNRVESGEVTADGNLVLTVYYTRRECNLIIMNGTGVESVSASGTGVRLNSESSSNPLYKVKYGATVTLSGTASAGYSVGFTKGSEVLSDNTYMQNSLEITITANAIANSYSLTYNTNGGNTITAVDKIYNSAFTTAELLTPTKTGYDFDGWYNSNSDSATKVEAGDLFTNSTATFANISTASSTATIYAKWTPKTNTAYKVEYYMQNILDDNYTIDDSKTENLTGTTGNTATVTAGAITGFTYDEDNTSNNTSDTIAGDGSLVLKVYYLRNTYTLSLDYGTGISSITVFGLGVSEGETGNLKTIKYGANVSLRPYIETGYAFAGWTVTGSVVTISQSGINYTYTHNVTSDVSITASATPNTYTLSFKKNLSGADPNMGTPTTISVVYNTAINATLPTPTCEHYEFGGWFKEKASTNEVTSETILNSSNIELNSVQKTAVVYAKWIACEYGDDWTYDDTNHWKVCTHEGCSDINNTASHSFDNACDTTCNVCEYTRTITHDYEYMYTADKHYKVCSVCNDTTPQEDHTYGDDGLCTVCSRTLLSMTYKSSESVYEVMGVGDYEGTTPTIPATYNDNIHGTKIVEYVGANAFKDNTSITSLNFQTPKSSETYSILGNAFRGCTNLESITLTGVKYIMTEAFKSCTKLSTVNLYSPLKKIEGDAFMDCTALTSIAIPSSVEIMGANPFKNCTNLATITVDSNNTYFKSDNSNCIIKISDNRVITGCKNSTIPSYVKIIGHSAFYYIEDLTNITLPNGLTTIEAWSFTSAGLTSISLPSTVTSIGTLAFCATDLTAVTIPSSVTTLEAQIFMNCHELQSATFEEQTSSSSSTQDVLTTLSASLFYGCDKLTTVNIPSTITTIDNQAFAYSKINSVSIPAGVTSIHKLAFIGCGWLESITVATSNTKYSGVGNCLIDKTTNTLIRGCKNSIIPTDGSVTKIGEHAFSSTKDAQRGIVIPAGVTEIATEAFAVSEFTYIVLSDDITTIGADAFRITALTTVYYYCGTAEQWAEIEINMNNTSAEHYDWGNYAVVYKPKYYYSATEPTTEGNYWHYVDETPTPWTTIATPGTGGSGTETDTDSGSGIGTGTGGSGAGGSSSSETESGTTPSGGSGTDSGSGESSSSGDGSSESSGGESSSGEE